MKFLSSTHFLFPKQNFPEISGFFREGRVVFNGNPKPKPDFDIDVTSKKTEAQKIKEALENSGEKLRELKEEVSKGSDEKIDTEAEIKLLGDFLNAEKLLDFSSLEEDTQISLSALRDSIDFKEVNENIETLEWVHKRISKLINEDVKYVEAVNEKEKISGAVQSSLKEKANKVFESSLPEDFSQVEDDEKDELLQKILEKVGSHTGPRSFPDNLESTLSEIQKDVIKFVLETGIIKSSAKIQKPENQEILKRWIKEDVKSKVSELKKEDYPIILKIENGEIDFKSEKEIKKESENSEKKESNEKLGDADMAINTIKSNLKSYREAAEKKTKGFGWLLKLLGIDLGDPTKTGGIYGILRGVFNIESPREDVAYSPEEDPRLKQFLEPLPHSLSTVKIQKISISDAFQKGRITKKALKYLSSPKKSDERKPLQNMVEDLMGRFQNAQILSVTQNRIKMRCSSPAEVVRAKTFFGTSHSSSIGEKAVHGILDEAIDKMGDIGNGILSSLMDNNEESEFISKYASSMTEIRKENGYPEVIGSSIGKDNRTITISLKNSGLMDKVRKTFGISDDKKSSTFPASVSVGSKTVLDK